MAVARTSIDVRFVCGHKVSLGRDGDLGEGCPTCGERKVAYVAAPTPSFRGTATGPHVETIEMEPVKVTFGD